MDTVKFGKPFTAHKSQTTALSGLTQNPKTGAIKLKSPSNYYEL
tara:strand:- start:392 stop:523 length:132 start_codon:yes stop_codon:yes gene_type:complete